MVFQSTVLFTGLLLAAAWAAPSAAQSVEFTSSNLPIVVIDTDGEQIPDEPKIPAHLGTIDNGPGVRNHITDPYNGYDGHIGIEVRGRTSQIYPKKSYAFETREADGSNNNVPLLGMPEENDWVLYGPYSDKSLMRNVLAYTLARRTGRYASRVRFCELVINGNYRGLYVLLEKIKRDDARVDIATLNPDETEGDDLTGGYIVRVDRGEGGDAGGWESEYLSNGFPANYEFYYPEDDDIAPEQATYIEGFVDHFEDVMVSEAFDHPTIGYPRLLDVGSFVDYLILNELTKNVDAYRLSAYMYKDKDSNDNRLVMGPLWDFNIAFGNADFRNGDHPYGFSLHNLGGEIPTPIPFWWHRLAESAAFTTAVETRWEELRQGPFHPDSLDALIDEQALLLDEAQARNFQRWPVLGEYVWPNPFVGETYAEETDYLKSWIRQRIAWVDANIATLGVGVTNEPGAPPSSGARLDAYPNPTSGPVRLGLDLETSQSVVVVVYDVLGRKVVSLHNGVLGTGRHVFTWHGASSTSGVYFVVATGEGFTARRHVTLTP